ncbi:hypothetical protein [Coleofasciculus sp. FACHB-1120]|uniref:hypothetical protein n=1 Tax=Coleofasciculus sp. FACHB-1120 TaxID=2692783 RepID=UPI0016848535|nr:hypothetical protein [Coleofasciculus sp. FACHB-1120]MBD2744120.1 hypothetical protein [Coleofasciculus sp. FACHB-1120]
MFSTEAIACCLKFPGAIAVGDHLYSAVRLNGLSWFKYSSLSMAAQWSSQRRSKMAHLPANSKSFVLVLLN